MNLLKTILSTSVFAIASVALHAQLPAKVESFPVRDVRLTASPFKHAEDMDIRYLLGIDPDRLLAPYLKEAGLSPKAENYTNWENTGLDGHIGGHYLSALSYMYAATGNVSFSPPCSLRSISCICSSLNLDTRRIIQSVSFTNISFASRLSV